MKTENLQLQMKRFFNESLVMFDKEMRFFYKTEGKNTSQQHYA